MRLDEFLRLNAPDDLATMTTAIAGACLTVWDNIPAKSGLLSSTNPSGETQKAIDVFANDLFAETLIATGVAAEVASEEMSDPAEGKGEISVAMDPLDGSSNVETNNPLGSIFGFYSKSLPTSGRNLLGALYVTYGNVITLTFTFGKGVHRFVAVREGQRMSFELLGVNLKLPDLCRIDAPAGIDKLVPYALDLPPQLLVPAYPSQANQRQPLVAVRFASGRIIADKVLETARHRPRAAVWS